MHANEGEKPLFSDEDGRALNEAAAKLVERAATGGDDARKALGGGNVVGGEKKTRAIETVKIADGTHKYILAQVFAEGDERHDSKLVVRSYGGCRYHADNYRMLMSEIWAEHGRDAFKGHVIGGGRLRYSSKEKKVDVWGYSMTFGRTEGCNKRTSEICKEVLNVETTWSDDGY